MMVPKELMVVEENDRVLEFRYNRNLLYLNLVALLGFYAVCFMMAVDVIPIEFLVAVGLLPLSLGILPLILGRRIIVDKQAKKLILNGLGFIGMQSDEIPFSLIRHIRISVSPLAVEAAYPRMSEVKDTIYLCVRGGNMVKLTVSQSDAYSNDFTYRLSEAIGCEVVTAGGPMFNSMES